MKIPVIDIFAGPGGLGEGFSSVKGKRGKRFFDIKLSIEMDKSAHETLELRSFFRQFPINNVPQEYYELLKVVDVKEWKEGKAKLFSKYKKQGDVAKNEAWNATLGEVPNTELDQRISEHVNRNKKWVLIGGPPCQAYSNIGRARVGGIDKKDKRVYLYKEYLRIIAVHQPAIFVMENVKGLLSAKVGGKKIFNKILEDLKSPSQVFDKEGVDCPDYKIFSLVNLPESDLFDSGDSEPTYKKDTDFLIKSEKYGIPQKRHRVILVGVRNDIDIKEIPILKEVEEIPLKDIIDDLPRLRSGVSRKVVSAWVGEDDKLKLEYEKIKDSPSVWKELVTKHASSIIQKNGFSKFKKSLKIRLPENGRGSIYVDAKPVYENNALREWYSDDKMEGVCNHETRSHLKEDLERYFFASLFVKKYNRFPRMHDYPSALLPLHQNAKSGKFADRFRVQMADVPATTVTSHISKDGHYFIHYDPEQCRSLTVREAARIQTFPDNYYFCGPRTSQYVQVGNAVPPFLAFKIGEIVKEIFKEVDEQLIKIPKRRGKPQS